MLTLLTRMLKLRAESSAALSRIEEDLMTIIGMI